MFTDNHWRDVLTSFHTIDIEIFCRMKEMQATDLKINTRLGAWLAQVGLSARLC